MAFYYPQDVPKEVGPTSVLPASQYYFSRSHAERQQEALLCGDAGTVTIVHYDLWHHATTNRSDRNRYMVKFLFCRMTEPTAPSWNCKALSWRTPGGDEPTPNLWQSVWNWHVAQVQSGFGQATGTGQPRRGHLFGAEGKSESVRSGSAGRRIPAFRRRGSWHS